MKNIYLNEWRGLLRNKILVFILCFFVFILSLVTYFGVLQNTKQIQTQKDARVHVRKQWDELGSYNPHSAAHYGTYAFKSNSNLMSLDEGVNAVTGLVLRLEGHKQHDVSFSEASQSLAVSRFGKLKSSLFFQFIIPIFLIFVSFNSFTSELSSGRLKLLIIQGNSLRKIVFSKILCILSIATILLFISVIIHILFNSQEFNIDHAIRLCVFFFTYFIYYFVIVSFTFLLSLKFKTSTSALSLTLIVWLLWTIFLPKTIGDLTEKFTPLSSRFILSEDMKEDRLKGIDGHNPSDKRRKKLEEEVLLKYKVDSVSQLPINFSGIVLQADEEYGNKIWDKHYGKLHEKLKQQKKNYQLSGFINPFASLQSLSMASCGTDLIHHIDFLNNSEKYRRYFVKTLNDEYTYGRFLSEEGGKKSSGDFFKSIKDFKYHEPSFLLLLSYYYIDVFSILFWFSSLVLLISYTSKKIEIR